MSAFNPADEYAMTKANDEAMAFRVDAEPFWAIERMRGGDGYDEMDKAIGHGWKPVSGWGRDGWDFLEWPYYVGYVRNRDGYELATNCEGDVTMWRFPTKEQRVRFMDELALWHWRRRGEPWVTQESREALTGPFSWGRADS